MRASDLWPGALLAAALLALLLGVPAFAEEDPEPDEPPAEEAEEPEPVLAEEARRLATLLERAAKRRSPADVLPVLDELDGRSHASFVKPLTKMLKHQSPTVAMRAAGALGKQRPANEKERKKLLKGLWKYGWTDRANQRRYNVQGAALAAIGKLEGSPLDDSRFRLVRKMWRAVHGEPQKTLAPAVASVCEYVRVTKDKRLCRLLAEAIDQPQATAVNSPTNPPAEWWERRYDLWKVTKADIVEVLEDLTGESFKDTNSAKEWFRANEKEFGFDW